MESVLVLTSSTKSLANDFTTFGSFTGEIFEASFTISVFNCSFISVLTLFSDFVVLSRVSRDLLTILSHDLQISSYVLSVKKCSLFLLTHNNQPFLHLTYKLLLSTIRAVTLIISSLFILSEVLLKSSFKIF